MFGVPSIEERIKQAKIEAEGAKNVIVSYEQELLKELDKVKEYEERIQNFVALRNKEVSRVGELTLLKDVRDGKLLVLDLESMEPARIAFL